MAEDSIFYRAKDIARMGNFSRTQVYNLIQKGLLPQPIKLGKIILWKREDVEAMFEKLSKGVTK